MRLETDLLLPIGNALLRNPVDPGWSVQSDHVNFSPPRHHECASDNSSGALIYDASAKQLGKSHPNLSHLYFERHTFIGSDLTG